jgi:hypothetical protein
VNGGSGKRCSGRDCDGQSGWRGLDGVGGDDDDKRARADGHTMFGEECAHALNGSADALSGGVLGRAERFANFAKRFVLEVAEQDGRAFGLIKRVHGFVEGRFDVCPVVVGGVHSVELGGNLFAKLAAGFATDDINGSASSDLIQPRGEDGIRREVVCLADEIGEGGLGDLFRELWRTDLAKRGGKNKIEMPPDDFGKGILGVLPGVSPEQLQVSISHLISISSRSKKPDKKECEIVSDNAEHPTRYARLAAPLTVGARSQSRNNLGTEQSTLVG